MMESFASKDIDLGYIGLPPVMIGIENGLKIKCVGGGHIEGTIMMAPNSFKSYEELGSLESVLKQFEGKTIGTPTKGCIHDVIIRDMTKNYDIKIENFPWADLIPDAIEDGKIAAGVGTPSLATVISNRLDSKVTIPPNVIWPWNPSYGIVVRKELIDESPEFIMDFLKSHEDASNLIRKQPEKAAEIALKEVGIVNKEFVLKTYNMSPKYCASIPKEYIESTLRFIPVLKNLGYMNGNLKQKDIFDTVKHSVFGNQKLKVFDTRFIKEIHQEPSHY